MLTDDLAEALREHPGLTTDQVAELVARAAPAGSGQQRGRAVRLALSGDPGRFLCDCSDPPRWWLAEHHRAARRVVRRVPASIEPSEVAQQLSRPAARSAPAITDATRKLQLYSWQVDALRAWARRGHRGVVEAVTGTGKTVLGLAAVGDELSRGGQALVLVPTIELMHQWRREIHRFLGPQVRVGCLGASESGSMVAHDIVVAVVNSARVAALRPIRRDGLLVADECHRYASAVNRLALGDGFVRRLGLSATYARDDGAHLESLDPYFGGMCFEMGYRRAVADGVTARFYLALVGVTLPAADRDHYEQLTDEIRMRLARLVAHLDGGVAPLDELLKALHRLAAERFPSAAQAEARALLILLHERRRLLAETPAKLEALLALAPAIRAADRSIVFTQSIAVAERAREALCSASLSADTVHSQLRAAARREALARFAAGSLQAIVAPRVLDEGIDVPEADLAIILAASRSRRQMVQRMGRVLRRKPDGRRARIAVLYAAGTVEDPATGAHETFLSEASSVADEVRDFRPPEDLGAAASLLARSTSPPPSAGASR